jgi:hypothetical protein
VRYDEGCHCQGFGATVAQSHHGRFGGYRGQTNMLGLCVHVWTQMTGVPLILTIEMMTITQKACTVYACDL